MSHRKERRPQKPKPWGPRAPRETFEYEKEPRPLYEEDDNEPIPQVDRCLSCGRYVEVDDLDKDGYCEKCQDEERL